MKDGIGVITGIGEGGHVVACPWSVPGDWMVAMWEYYVIDLSIKEHNRIPLSPVIQFNDKRSNRCVKLHVGVGTS